ncbi:MAG TPA: hypothetical protein VH352_07185 [Pseudonocardiaceae bacterium]|jgi:hypothetical protein|nr:hypothetical protein [Pseudonocardiaceae bacterium]
MTHGIPSLKQLAAEAVDGNQVPPNALPDDLLHYLASVVNLTDIVNEPAAIQQDFQGLGQTIRNITEEDFNQLYLDLLEEARKLIARCNRVLNLIQSAIEFIEQEQDAAWREYYTAQCTNAIDVLNPIKAMCDTFIQDFQNYQPGAVG